MFRKSPSPDGYATEYRIEIDAILAEVGAEGLWKYIMHKVTELAPFDLNKSIDMPANEVLYPPDVSEFLSFLNEYTDGITKDERDEIEDGLSFMPLNYSRVEVMENGIDTRLSHSVAEDRGMKLIVSKLIEVRRGAERTGEEDEEYQRDPLLLSFYISI